PPLRREWVTVIPPDELPWTAGSKVGCVADQGTFKLMSYNILHDHHARPAYYHYTPAWTLHWEHRKRLILQELLEYDAEVICLQEVGIKSYEDFFAPSLEDKGYEGVFHPKSRARSRNQSKKRLQVDGCATFVKKSIFELIEYHCVDFNELPMLSDLHKTVDMLDRVKSKDNIAQIVMLQHRRTGARQLVANIHLFWNPEFKDVKVVQTAMLTQQLERLAKHFTDLPLRTHTAYSREAAPQYSGASIIVCGDFNSLPDSGVYHYLSSGALKPNHEDYLSHDYGPFTESGIQHTLELQSAYSQIGELPLTNYTPYFRGTIDYIFYSPNSLAVTRVLGKVDPDYLSKVSGFPNVHFPSDHVPVLAEFQV
ncbi:hypothetical protein CROQUDRAFT_10944, partial [Cronartium quercuum f. sp. fusiforme G11]